VQYAAFLAMSDRHTPEILELPSAFLALLLQHTASGPGGLASAAALSQTCKYLHSLSEGPAVAYSNIHVPGTIRSPAHQVWQWLAKRSARIAGLRLQLRVAVWDDADEDAKNDELLDWTQHLQTLSGIPGVQLRVEWGGSIVSQDLFFLTQWLMQHGEIISHLSMQVQISEDRLNLRDFVKAAAPCKDLELSILHEHNESLDLAHLAPLAGSLGCLTCHCNRPGDLGIVRGLHVLSSLQQLTYLCLDNEDLGFEEPWEHLAKLTSLNRLCIEVRASGDPSPLSALTRLSFLHLCSLNDAAPFTFSSLQPLSTLQQLEVLELWSHSSTATSLQGLAGLTNLEKLELGLSVSGALRSLEGIGSEVADLSIYGASDLVSLAGIEVCSSLRRLFTSNCGLSSLQPLRGLSSLTELTMSHCGLTSLQGLCSRSLQILELRHCSSLTSLSGIEQLKALNRVEVNDCGVTSLQPLSQLGGGIVYLIVQRCKKVQEVVLELPHIQTTCYVGVYGCSVRKLVLAGGVIKAVQ
jgi:Leucine-rich repeat (LRR) protein